MPHNDDTTTKLFEIIEPVCASAGFELVDLRFVREQQGWILRVFIDKLPGPDAASEPRRGEGVGIRDCARISRELGVVLDVEDPISQAYSLEVSSPGVDRPLRTSEHFRRFRGETAKIALHPGTAGRRNFRGTIVESDDDTVVIDADGEHHRISIDTIQTAKLIPDWDALMKTGAGVAPSTKHQDTKA